MAGKTCQPANCIDFVFAEFSKYVCGVFNSKPIFFISDHVIELKMQKKNPYNLRLELILFIVGGFVLVKLTFGIFVWMAYNCIHSMAASIEKVCNVCKSFYFISSLFFYKKKQFPPLECTETAWYKFNVNIGWYQKNPNVFFMAKNLHWFEEFFSYLSSTIVIWTRSFIVQDSIFFFRFKLF